MALALAACADKTPPPVKKPVAAPAPKPKQGRVTAISLDTLYTLQQAGKVRIYDVRPSFVYAFGHLPGAVNWPRSAFDSQLASRQSEIRAAAVADQPVVLYCTDAACPDGRAVAERLAALGHTVAVLEGGYAIWKDAGLPVE